MSNRISRLQMSINGVMTLLTSSNSFLYFFQQTGFTFIKSYLHKLVELAQCFIDVFNFYIGNSKTFTVGNAINNTFHYYRYILKSTKRKCKLKYCILMHPIHCDPGRVYIKLSLRPAIKYYTLICPLPLMNHFSVTNFSSANGPRACSF